MRGTLSPLTVYLHGLVLNQARYIFMAWCLFEHNDSFTFTFI